MPDQVRHNGRSGVARQQSAALTGMALAARERLEVEQLGAVIMTRDVLSCTMRCLTPRKRIAVTLREMAFEGSVKKLLILVALFVVLGLIPALPYQDDSMLFSSKVAEGFGTTLVAGALACLGLFYRRNPTVGFALAAFLAAAAIMAGQSYMQSPSKAAAELDEQSRSVVTAIPSDDPFEYKTRIDEFRRAKVTSAERWFQGTSDPSQYVFVRLQCEAGEERAALVLELNITDSEGRARSVERLFLKPGDQQPYEATFSNPYLKHSYKQDAGGLVETSERSGMFMIRTTSQYFGDDLHNPAYTNDAKVLLTDPAIKRVILDCNRA